MKFSVLTHVFSFLVLASASFSAHADTRFFDSEGMKALAVECRDVAIHAKRGNCFASEDKAIEALTQLENKLAKLKSHVKELPNNSYERSDLVARLTECDCAIESAKL